MRILTCIGDVSSPNAWSGTPYHLLKSAQRSQFLHDGWRLDPRRLRRHRLAWNTWQKLVYGERGGFQYTEAFLRRLRAQVGSISKDAEIISHFPLFPAAYGGIDVSFYIDATLTQNFEAYGLAADRIVGRRTMSSAIAREQAQYQTAKHIVCMSAWAAKSVVEHYRITATKVHIVPAGANIDPDSPRIKSKLRTKISSPLKLGFLGKDWQRKNLPFLLDVADNLQVRGIKVEVNAAGFDPALGPKHPLLRAIGYIDKNSEPERFIAFIRSCHFTCLFSSAEAFGISNRESLHLGIPVLARNVGGISDSIPKGCGHLFPSGANAESVADIIEAYVHEPERYLSLRAHVEKQSHTFTWDAAVSKLTAIWAGSVEYSYANVQAKNE